MSRTLLACSFLAALSAGALSSTALAERAAPSFARPPAGWAAAHDRGARVLDRDAVRAKLAAARAANLARFRAYQRKGVFPSNTYSDGRLNVWRDEAGHLCAAATIINASGQTELVAQVADESNFIRLADVTSGPLLDWILTSGFTQAEIAAIQEPFLPVSEEPQDPRSRPAPSAAIDARRRTTEDQRLVRRYREVEAMLVKNAAASLELAVDRLMSYPQLARQLLDA
jgi:hypothetical protein